MLWQCCGCAGKIDDQEDDYEALELEVPNGRVWHYWHALCLDTLRALERKRKELGTSEKPYVPQNVRSIAGSWSGEKVLST